MGSYRSLIAILAWWSASEAVAQNPAQATRDAPAARALSPRGVENLAAATRVLSYVRFFHPSDQAAGVGEWDRFAVHVMERVEAAGSPDDLARRLTELFAPIAPTLEIWAGPAASPPLLTALPAGATHTLSWKHTGVGTLGSRLPDNVYHSEVKRSDTPADEIEHARNYLVKDLGGGVACRLPVGVYADADGTLPHRTAPEHWVRDDRRPELSARDRSVRLAGVALAWGVFQHFYPYFDVVQTDWKAVLPAALSKAATDSNEIAYRQTLWEMLAQLHDGHADASKQAMPASTFLPLSVQWAGTELVVVGDDSTEAVKPGDVILSIDGRSTEDCYSQVSKWISAATDGWRRWQSIHRLMINLPTADPVAFSLRRPDGSTYSVTLARVTEWPANTATLKRPGPGAELSSGIVYFNLDRATVDDLHQAMGRLEQARGIVFDMRGYPADGAIELIQHLINAPAASQRWIVPVFRRPDQEGVQWSQADRWNLQPKSPRLTAKTAFLIDGRAISYAESIMGIVEHYRLGEIVGSTTAGTNGNINPFVIPGGFIVTWSGMIVLKHDGSRHHGVGIAPTVPVVPTPAGIAMGKDEVLQKAVEVLKAKFASGEPTGGD